MKNKEIIPVAKGKNMIRPTDNPKPFTTDIQPKTYRGPARIKILQRMQDLIYGTEEYFKIKGAEIVDGKGRPTGKIVNVRVKLVRAQQLALHGVNLMMKHRDMFRDFLDRDSGKAVETIRMGNVDESNDPGFTIILK